MVERSQIDKVIQELKLHMTGFISQETAIRAGRLAGASLIITGTLSDIGKRVGVRAKIVRVETGEGDVTRSLTAVELAH